MVQAPKLSSGGRCQPFLGCADDRVGAGKRGLDSTTCLSSVVSLSNPCMSAVFTERELEKDPLREVPDEPYELLDKTR